MEHTKTVASHITLLELDTLSPDQQELGLREFRIRGIDTVLDQLKKVLGKEERTALNNHLKMCPSVECLTAHLEAEYTEFTQILENYLPKLHKVISNI